MIKTSIATIVLLISQTNAMDSESNAMDVESFVPKYEDNSIELEKKEDKPEFFAREYGNNFKELENQRAQQDPSSSEDPYHIRYWVFNQLDKVIPVTTYTATATSTLFKRDNSTNYSISDKIPQKYFTFLCDKNFDQLEKSLKDKHESDNPFFPTPRFDFGSCFNTVFIEDNSKHPFGSIFIITELNSDDFTSCNIETISFHTIMDIIFNTDENTVYGLLPKELRRLIGFKYLELKIELPENKPAQISSLNLSGKREGKSPIPSPFRFPRRAEGF